MLFSVLLAYVSRAKWLTNADDVVNVVMVGIGDEMMIVYNEESQVCGR
jgi:hypothetical protein